MLLEQTLFLKILSDHLNRRKTENPSDSLDWSLIFHYAQIQQVEGIVYCQCKSFLPDEVKTLFQDKYYASIDGYAKREYLVKKLKSSLCANKIESFIVKGFPVASCYPLAPLRTMCDTDIIVHSSDRQRVHNILIEQGYLNESCYEDREWIYYKDKFILELHDRLIYSEAINRRAHEEFFVNFWDYVHDGELDWNYHFLYLILHLRKHLMNYGVGFRQFMDVAVVSRNSAVLNWKWIVEKLVELDLIDFSEIVFTLNESWFGIKVPIKTKAIEKTFYECATEQVFNNGVFGFDNEVNKDNLAVNVARNGKNSKTSMFFSAARKIFPSYESLIRDSNYSFITGKKWLLPVAWIYRIFKGTNKTDFSRNVNIVKSSFVSKDTIEKREEYLKLWGLDEVD